MIKHLTHNDIDKQRWDICIKNSPNGNVYAWSWYLDIVHPGWEALVEDDYDSVMPLTGSSKFGVRYLFQPFFVQQLGVFSRKLLSQDAVMEFIYAIPEKYKFAEIRLNSENHLPDTMGGVGQHRNIELWLRDGYDNICKKYNSNTKRDIAKAKAANINVCDDIDEAEIVTLFRKNRGMDVKHWGDAEYERFIDLVNVAKANEHCFMRGALDAEKKLVAGAIFMKSHGRIVFIFSGADETNKELHGLSLIIDSVIRQHCGTNDIFDFEGSDNDGLARYYKGFGGEERYYPSMYFNRLCWPLKMILKILKNK